MQQLTFVRTVERGASELMSFALSNAATKGRLDLALLKSYAPGTVIP